MSTHSPKPLTGKPAPDARIAIVAARFNAHIVDELLRGCEARLLELGMDRSHVETFRVPGAFELPVAAKAAIETGRFSAVICLGCVIRGETSHYDLVAGQAARGILNVSIETVVPVIFGVLTTENEQQARDRTGGKHGHAGASAADSALEMIAFTILVKSGKDLSTNLHESTRINTGVATDEHR